MNLVPCHSLLWTFFTLVSVLTSTFAYNPYHVLGVQRSESIPEIKRAYKNLARKYHPDKNKDSDSEDMFIAINKAYDLLMDPERRRLYDKTGQTETDLKKHKNFNAFDFDTFDSYFTNSGSGHRIKFTVNSNEYYRKNRISYR